MRCSYAVVDDKLLEDIAVEQYDFPVSIALTITLGWMLVCAAVFQQFETSWSYMTAFYFCFTSLSTIGLGDVVPSRSDTFVALFVLVLIGMAFVSMSINLVQFKVEAFVEKIVDQVRNQSSSFEDSNTELYSDENQQIERALTNAVDDKPRAKLLMNLLGHHQKRMLMREYERKMRQKDKAVQAVVEVREVGVSAVSDPRGFRTKAGMQRDMSTDSYLMAEVADGVSGQSPARETPMRRSRRSTDECRDLLTELDFVINDCVVMVQSPQRKISRQSNR